MGFHLTAMEERAEEKAHLPPKNRVWDFFEQPSESVGIFPVQVLEPHREKQTCSTTTASGVRYYGFRYYKPQLGRWLNRDPIKEDGGNNLYQFIKNEPISSWDYLGLIKCCKDGVLGEWKTHAFCDKSWTI